MPAIDAPQLEPLAVDARGLGRLLSLSRATIFELHGRGKLPLPMRFGARGVRWYVPEVRAWLEAGRPDRAEWEKLRQAQRQAPSASNRK